MSCNDTTAAAWLWFMSKFKNPPSDEKSRMAMLMIDKSIVSLQDSEQKMLNDLKEIQKKLKVHTSGNKKKGIVLELIRQGKVSRKNLLTFQQKRIALENQKQTLETSSINQQVISTVKQTSDALKSLGLDESLKSVDTIMIEMEEMTQDVNSISSDLGANMSGDLNLADDEIADELNSFLSEDFDNAYYADIAKHPSKSNTQTIANVANLPSKNSMETIDEVYRHNRRRCS